MRTPILPLRYFLFLVLVIVVMIVAEIVFSEGIGTLTLVIQAPFEGTVFGKIFETVFILIFILVLYTIGVYLIVRKIPDEASRFIAVRIFIAILLGFALLLGMLEWVEDPGQIVLILGIIWGALLVALRDLIQNVVGSLTLLVTRMYRIGDRIQVKGVYGLVMDIGIFRTTMMELDRESGDHPVGDLITIPNGILFREVVKNTSQELSVTADEIRITLPFTIDQKQARQIVLDIVNRYTRDIQSDAAKEIGLLGEKKYLPAYETQPAVYFQIDGSRLLLVVRYFTDPCRRSEIMNRIVEDISQHIPVIINIDREGAG